MARSPEGRRESAPLRLGAALAILGASSLLTGASTAPADPAAVAPWVRLHAEGPPPGYTGGFGEPTCQACHDEYDLDVGGELVVEGLPESYRPGESYEVTVVLHSSEMGRAGFQAAIRREDGPRRGEPAGTVEAVDARVRVVSADSVGPTPYVQQTWEGSAVRDPSRVSWTFRWTAPPEPVPVVLHAAANSANDDESPLGDLVYTVRQRMTGEVAR